jgi:hypothetical protein
MQSPPTRTNITIDNLLTKSVLVAVRSQTAVILIRSCEGTQKGHPYNLRLVDGYFFGGPAVMMTNRSG